MLLHNVPKCQFAFRYCGASVDIFKTGGGEKLASETGVPFLGRIPIDPEVVEHSDSGRPFLQYVSVSETTRAFETVMEPLLKLSKEKEGSNAGV